MFVLPLMFSIVLKTVLAMSEQLQQVSPPIGTEVFIQTYVKQIVWPDTALNHWIKGSLKSLTDDFTDSFVDMPVSAAPTNIGEQYQFARSYILATNLGSLSTYFSQYSQMYVSDNTAAFINGVPVVRYFFFDRTKPIFTDTRKDSVDDFRTFTKDVIDRSVKPCETPFAEAINVTDYNDEAKKKLRDVLFTDAPFFALTQMDEHWLPVSVKATESPSTEKVNDAFASLSTCFKVILVATAPTPILTMKTLSSCKVNPATFSRPLIICSLLILKCSIPLHGSKLGTKSALYQAVSKLKCYGGLLLI